MIWRRARTTGSKPGRRRVIAGLAALGLVGGSGAVALASPAYTVKLTVAPSSIQDSHYFKVTANGVSSNRSRLTIFLADDKCAKTAKAEVKLAKATVFSHNLVHGYSKHRLHLARFPGTHYACAYLVALPPAMFTRAHASASYQVVAAAG